MNFKKISAYILITISVALVYLIGMRFGKSINDKTDYNDTFDVYYVNDQDYNQKIRYKYELSFKTTEDFNPPAGWYANDYLFALYENNFKVNNTTLENKNKPIIPQISNTIILKPNEFIEDTFQIMINDKIKPVENLIKFETKIIVEELRNKRWTPVYQVILMKRGPYWSLNKGPTEYKAPTIDNSEY